MNLYHSRPKKTRGKFKKL